MDNSKLEELKKLAQESIREAQDTNALNDVRVRFLGKKGEITSLLKSMKDLSAEAEVRSAGQCTSPAGRGGASGAYDGAPEEGT